MGTQGFEYFRQSTLESENLKMKLKCSLFEYFHLLTNKFELLHCLQKFTQSGNQLIKLKKFVILNHSFKS